MHADVHERLARELRTRWGIPSSEVRYLDVPYRVSPLGAHIDHQLGTVTGMAIDRYLTIAFVPNSCPEVRVISLNYPSEVRCALDAVDEPIPGDWGNYVRGAVRALARVATLRQGFMGVVAGEMAEMGLSSSAALGLACLSALARANDIRLTAEDLIRLDQHLENQYLGLRNGILDPATILLSRRGHLTVIDCRAFANATPSNGGLPPGISRVGLPTGAPGVGVLVAFSGLRRALVSSDYNRRVEECAQAAKILLMAAGRPEAPPRLSEVTEAEYEVHRHRLQGLWLRRADHYFGEMRRVREGLAAWQAGDLERFGSCVRDSGLSSLKNYECGSPPLADLQQLLNDTPGVWGARFSGAGFRGSCVAFGTPEALEEAVAPVRAAYAARHPEAARDAQFFVCRMTDGVL